MKRIMTALLALALCCSLIGTALAAPDYLNLESNGINTPILTEGANITLRVVMSQAATQADASQIWLWEYFKQFHHMKFEIEQVMDAREYKNLAFASGDLPDILLNIGLTAADLVTYGMDEGMLLPIDEYIDDYMPNLKALYDQHPEWKEAIAAPDGHIYSMGQMSDPNDETRNAGYFINSKWLGELGLDMPTTVDEFVDVLRAFQSAHPDGTAFNGGYNASNPSLILLNGYGFNTRDAKGLDVSLRNGEVLFPYADREVYGAYLQTMNTLYSEGLMSHDFYSLDDTAIKANVAMSLAGTYSGTPWAASTAIYMDWDTPEPLTSAYNETKFWPNNSAGAFTIGRYAINADTKYPELACKLLDFFFTGEGIVYAFYGPMEGSGVDTYGMTSGWRWNEATNWILYDDILNDTENRYGGMENMYRQQKIMWFTGVQLGDIRFFFEDVAAMAATDYRRVWTLDSLDFRHYATMVASEKPYYVDTYPGTVYFTQEINNRVTDLRTVINAYVESESAKFITGARPLTEAELKAYFDGLDALGYPEYLGYYEDYYANNVTDK
ncbi:ABC transporter substrate-binding protein [Clostridia bacterium]|nr:ABC transporter substrate-binding protein [Clostridia bacterium]